MDASGTIQVTHAIVHLVDPKRPGGYARSERTLPLADEPEVAEFLVSRIRIGLRDPSTRTALFDPEARDGIRSECERAMRGGRSSFVSASRKIAARLHDILNNDKRISGATLVVCRFTLESDGTSDSWLGVLKMDPSRVFRPVVRKDSTGAQFVTFESIQNVLPTSGDRLQKCGFVPAPDADKPFDLVLLDRQHSVADEAARFFTEDFFGATLTADPRQSTRRFYTGVLGVLDDLRESLPPKKAEQVRQSLDEVVQLEDFVVDEWISESRIPETAKQAIRDQLSGSVPPRVIVDASVASKLTRKRTYRGDNGFSLTVGTEPGEAVLVGEPEQTTDSNGNELTRFVVRVENYREVVTPTRRIIPESDSADSDPDSPRDAIEIWYPETDVKPSKGKPFEIGVLLPFSAKVRDRRDQLNLIVTLTSIGANISPEMRSVSLSRFASAPPTYFEITPLEGKDIDLSLSMILQDEGLFLSKYKIDIPVAPDES